VTERLQTILKSKIIHWLLFALCAAALYGFTLPYPFVFDDRIYILGNPLLSSTEAFRNLFDSDELMEVYLDRVFYQDMLTSFLLRPLTYLSFLVNINLFGYSPAGFRAVNIAIHVVNAMLLYKLLETVLKRRGDLPHSIPVYAIPFFSALLFLIHPLQIQSVTYITQRFTSFVTLFYLCTMLLYISATGAQTVSKGRFLYGTSMITFLLGLMTKESIVTVPLALLLADIILLRRPWRMSLKSLAPHFLLMGILPLQMYRIAEVLRDKNHLLTSATDVFGGTYSRFDYVITQIRAVLSYLRLLAIPVNQNFDPDYPLYQSLLHPEIIISILIWIVIVVSGVLLLRRQERNICTDLAAFAIFWFPLAISPSSSFVPLTDLMFEHRAYIPSMAFFSGGVAWSCMLVAGNNVARRALVAGFCTATIIFSLLTVQRNLVFASRLSIWQDTVSKNPNKARPHYALGNVYLNHKQFDEAVSCFDRALDLNPDYYEPYLTLGSAYLQMGLPQKAADLYEEYLEIYEPRRRLVVNLALAYSRLGYYLDALRMLDPFMGTYSHDARMLAFVSELNLRIGRTEEAFQYLARAMDTDREDLTIDLSAEMGALEQKLLETISKSSLPKT